MAATKSAVRGKTATRNPNPLQPFVWQGTDKRGNKMKGEDLAKNANLLNNRTLAQFIL